MNSVSRKTILQEWTGNKSLEEERQRFVVYKTTIKEWLKEVSWAETR